MSSIALGGILFTVSFLATGLYLLLKKVEPEDDRTDDIFDEEDLF